MCNPNNMTYSSPFLRKMIQTQPWAGAFVENTRFLPSWSWKYLPPAARWKEAVPRRNGGCADMSTHQQATPTGRGLRHPGSDVGLSPLGEVPMMGWVMALREGGGVCAYSRTRSRCVSHRDVPPPSPIGSVRISGFITSMVLCTRHRRPGPEHSIATEGTPFLYQFTFVWHFLWGECDLFAKHRTEQWAVYKTFCCVRDDSGPESHTEFVLTLCWK